MKHAVADADARHFPMAGRGLRRPQPRHSMQSYLSMGASLICLVGWSGPRPSVLPLAPTAVA